MSGEKESRVMERNPVVRTARWAVSLMKNKLVASLLLLMQGILFIVSPEADMRAAVQIGSAVIAAACAVNILLHLLPKDRGGLDVLLAALNGVVIAAAVFCFVSPGTVEPFVRVLVGAVIVLTNLINLAETLKIERKGSWKFRVGLFTSIVMMGVGLAMMIADAAKVEVMQQGVGVFLILNALTNIWYILRLGAARKTGRAG